MSRNTIQVFFNRTKSAIVGVFFKSIEFTQVKINTVSKKVCQIYKAGTRQVINNAKIPNKLVSLRSLLTKIISSNSF